MPRRDLRLDALPSPLAPAQPRGVQREYLGTLDEDTSPLAAERVQLGKDYLAELAGDRRDLDSQ